MADSTSLQVDIKFLRGFIVNAFLDALDLLPSGLLRLLLKPIVWTPAHIFSHLGAKFDNKVAELGFAKAAQWVLPRFTDHIGVIGLEHIPTRAPLIIAANHPGGLDALTIVANIPRDDIKILALDIPFIQGLPNLSKYFIYSTADNTSTERMLAVRKSIRHLRVGGALLIFPAGHIGPDPAVLPGAGQTIEAWSPSLEIFLRRVPEAAVQLAIQSHVTLPRFFEHPIPRLRKEGVPRQVLAQHLQVAYQLIRPRYFQSPKLTFAAPLTPADFQNQTNLLKFIQSRALILLREHTRRFLPK